MSKRGRVVFNEKEASTPAQIGEVHHVVPLRIAHARVRLAGNQAGESDPRITQEIQLPSTRVTRSAREVSLTPPLARATIPADRRTFLAPPVGKKK